MSDPQTAQADALHERYRRGFVGRTRATRDLSVLDAIIADTEAFLGGLGAAASLRAVVTERVELYRTERVAIAAIHAGGADAIQAWRLVEWSEVTNLRYRRLYGGQMRITRDEALLAEMVNEQRGWIEALTPLAARLQDPRLDAQLPVMRDHLKLYTAEVAEIQKALRELAPIDRATTFATLANRQFALWRLHFQGRSRTTRRVQLLRRILTNLESILAGMVACRAAGVTVQANTENITKVTERIAHHKDELAKIVEAQTNTPTRTLVPQLGDDANKWIARYRDEFAGKSRNGVNLAPLDDICEGLHEVARGMDEGMKARGGDAVAAKNLTVVLDHVKMCEREWATIRELQRKA